MDMNLVVIGGSLVTDPEIRRFESGAYLARYLLTVRSEEPERRVDVVPVIRWEPSRWESDRARGDRLWITGMVQRRFSGDHGRSSRLEVVATSVGPHGLCGGSDP